MENHESLPKEGKLTDGILREVTIPTGRSEIEPSLGK